jgi:putative ABC transport system ATP-binding protein
MTGCDLEVRQGEFVAVMGPSGSGKSTLLHLLGGIDRPDSGEIWIGGECLTDMNETQLTLFRRDQIGFVFQFFNLIQTLTVEENISLPLLIAGCWNREAIKTVEALLEIIGLSNRRSHKPGQLSGGERQRVAIARAFVTDPKLILLDEPTGNLDSKTGSVLLGLLAKTQKELGKTVVMVTHSPVAAAYSERTVFLKDGMIISSLSIEQAGHYDAGAIDATLLGLL